MSLKGIELQHNIDLKKYTTIKIGGMARYFFVAHTLDDLRQIVNDIGSSFYVLGRGSNLLIKDGFIETPVIQLGEDFNYIKRNRDDSLEVGASTPFSVLLKYCLKDNLGGLENLVGIPASIGGLLSLNASAFGREVSSCVRRVRIMKKDGTFKLLSKEQVVFGYRFSSLQGDIILGAEFILFETPGLKQKAGDLFKKRIALQDFSFPSCGCIFKNPFQHKAGFLIDSCGLKGLSRGGACVSPKHANFIINKGLAAYDDVDYLINKIKECVYKKYGITLEEEIKRWS